MHSGINFIDHLCIKNIIKAAFRGQTHTNFGNDKVTFRLSSIQVRFLFSGSDLKCIFTDLCINYTCTLSSDSKHKKQQVKDVHDAQKCHCKFFDMLDKNAENKKKPCNIRAGYLLDI